MSQETEAGAGIADVKEHLDGDLLESAAESGVDVDEIIGNKLTKHDGYQAKTIAKFASSDIERRVEAENAETVNGIVMGSSDRYGANFPRRHAIVRSSGEHTQVSTWEGRLPGPGGEKVDIPIGGSIVAFQCEYQEKYDDYTARGIASIKEMDHGDLIEALNQVALSPGEITRADEEEIVVVKGEVRFVDPPTRFKDNKPVGDDPILMEDERGEARPTMELTLAQENNNSVSGNLERMAYARPFVQVPDFFKMVDDAFTHRDDPEDQAEFVAEGLRGTEVFFVGRVNRFDTNRGDEGEPTNYITIGLNAIVENDTTVQQSLEDSATDEAEEEAEEEEEPEPEPEPEQDEGDEVPEAVQGAADDIEQYASLVNEDPATFTFADIEDTLDLDYPDAAVRAALDTFGDGGEDEAEEAEAEEADEPEDPQEAAQEPGPEDVPGYDDLPFNPEDQTVDEIRDLVDDVDDKETLVNLKAAEAAGKDRKSAKTAFARRASKLEEEGESDDDEDESDDVEVTEDNVFEIIKDGDVYPCPGTDDDGEDCIASAGSTGELVGHVFEDHDVTSDPQGWLVEQVQG